MPVKNSIAEGLGEFAAIRQDIHAHPELMYDTHRTSALVADKLRAWGCDSVTEGVGRTGVVAVIKGRSDTAGRVIGMRADMDALPIEEATGLDYASTSVGKMHACGHDGHTATLLSAAKYLADTRLFDGTVVLVFQPAEEGGLGGKTMVDEGLMDRWGIQEIYALHNAPGLPVGQFAIRPGPLLAAADEFEIHIEGKGGHAARPQVTVDSTIVACQIITAMQTIVSRNADPTSQAVLSVTSVETSSKAFNVIPQRVHMKGTVRTHSKETRAVIEARMRELIENTATAMGASARLDFEFGAPPTINAPDQTAFAAEVATGIAGTCNEAPLIMGAEDFSFMLEARPGAFILMGNGDSGQLHHPEYNFNDEAIPFGATWFAELAERRMPLATV